MPSTCGQGVNSLRMNSWISRGQLSTPRQILLYNKSKQRGQPGFSHYLSPALHSTYPRFISLFSPLIEHNLYPVSTAPTITPTKRKFKERY